MVLRSNGWGRACLAGLATLWLSGAQLANAACLYGSLTDCNPAGTTLNPAAAFVDADPPAGFVQCAGFRNTASDDVRWDWENNCALQKDGVLFVRVFDDASGTLIAGARLFQGVAGCSGSDGRAYRTDLHEGEGLLDNPGLTCGSGGVTFGWHTSNLLSCTCSRPGGTGRCDDIQTANAANDKILYVGASSSAHNYEAVWGPPGPKGTCALSAPLTTVRVATYVTDLKCGDGVLDADNACDDGNFISGDGCDRDCRVEPCHTCSGEPSTCTMLPNGTSCDDGLFCNGSDTCSGGSCTAHTGNPCSGGPECNRTCNEINDNCLAAGGTTCTDDGNDCTRDQCDGLGSCTHPADVGICDDGIFCNGFDLCNAGTCSFHLGSPCNSTCRDVCDEEGLQCLATSSGTACFDDGFECTSDECDGAGTCVHPPIPDCATYTPTPTRTPFPTEPPVATRTSSRTRTFTSTPVDTATPTPEPAPASLRLRRVRLKANRGTSPGALNGNTSQRSR